MPKPIKTGGQLVRDADNKVLKFNSKQALKFANKSAKDSERRFNNGYKYKHVNIKDCGEYWSISIC